jgi:cupin superfamily acireductone dioxygenase involved in methionine salvage
MSKVAIKKEMDNTTKIVNSNEKIAVLLAQLSAADAKAQDDTIDILNDICKELEERNGKYETGIEQQYSHLKVMK